MAAGPSRPEEFSLGELSFAPYEKKKLHFSVGNLLVWWVGGSKRKLGQSSKIVE